MRSSSSVHSKAFVWSQRISVPQLGQEIGLSKMMASNMSVISIPQKAQGLHYSTFVRLRPSHHRSYQCPTRSCAASDMSQGRRFVGFL